MTTILQKPTIMPTPEQLLYDPKIRNSTILGQSIDFLRKNRPNIKIGFTNGKFRTLHGAHCVFLNLCRTKCDILVVAVNSDYSLRTIKETSPFSEKERAFALANLNAVDYVTIFDEPTPYMCISIINPDVVFKGPDYEGKDVVCAGKPVQIIHHPFTNHASDVLNSEEFKYFKV